MKEKLEKIKELESLLALYCQGKATTEECERVERWIESDKEIEKEALEAYRLNRLLSDAEIMQRIDTEKALEDVNIRLRRGRLYDIFTFVRRYAAILLVPLLLLYLFIQQNEKTDVPVKMMEIIAKAGSVTRVTLPDGSIVRINGNSTLRYPQKFKEDMRNVALDGEAYFEVTHNPSRPFVVSLPQGMKVEVLGTKFNVDAYSADKIVSATLVEGCVNFKHENRLLTLKPGEKVVCNKTDNSLELYDVNTDDELAWTENRLVFNNTPLTDAVNKLEKYYNVLISLKNLDVKDISFTGDFQQEKLETILQSFRISSDIHWKDCGIDKATGRKKIELYSK